MEQVAADRRGRKRRLAVILVVTAVVAIALFGFGIYRSHRLNDSTDAAVSQLKARWRPIDLVGLADAYSKSTTDAASTGDYGASYRLFPTASHTDFSGAQFLRSGEVQANYAVHGWAGGTQCLTLTATGPTPNRVAVSRGGAGC